MPDAANTPARSRSTFGRWDGKLPRSILSDYDLRVMAHGLRGPLHYTTGTTECDPSSPCAMCGNAMRLVVQSAEPRIIERAIKQMAAAVGHSFIDLHPPLGDD